MWVGEERVVDLKLHLFYCNTDVIGADPTNNEPSELDAVWDMPSGPVQHG